MVCVRVMSELCTFFNACVSSSFTPVEVVEVIFRQHVFCLYFICACGVCNGLAFAGCFKKLICPQTPKVQGTIF